MTADLAPVPPPDPDIYVLLITHSHERDVTVHASREDAMTVAASHARNHWEEIGGRAGVPASPDSLDDRQAASVYFSAFTADSYAIIPAALPRPLAGPGLSAEQAANRTARFLPARDEDEEPAIDLAGAL